MSESQKDEKEEKGLEPTGGEEKKSESENKEKAQGDQGLLPDELLEQLPQPTRGLMMAISRSGPMPSPLIEKVTSDHIDKVLEGAAKEAERDADERRRTQILIFCTVMAILLFLGGHRCGAGR